MKYLIIVATLFVIGSVFGYVLEVFFRRIFSQHRWVNPGFMVGPYIPLYGFETCILYGFSNIPLEKAIPYEGWRIFVIILLIGVSLTLIELIGGLIFIKGMHIKLWDYSKRWGNFQGIICPLFSVLWLIAGALYYFFVNPYLVKAVDWISENLIYSFFIGIIIGMMIVDAAYSIHLGTKIRKASNNLTVRFEDFKEDLKNSPEGSAKHRFYGTIIDIKSANKSLSDTIKNHVERLPKPKKWWRKKKEKPEAIENQSSSETEKKE